MPRYLYDIVLYSHRSVVLLRQADTFNLRYVPTGPVREHYALIIGDVLHNLRSALDYWMSAAVHNFGSTRRTGRFSMPFGSDIENLKSQPSYNHIEKAFPEAAEFVAQTIQPYQKGAGHTLSIMSRLNNSDKHEFILPTVAVGNVRNIHATIGTTTLSDCAIGGNAANEINMITSGTPIRIQQDFKTSVEVRLTNQVEFDNDAAILVLQNFIDETSQVLEKCEDFLHRFECNLI
ncbi:hypothetical protein GTW25_18060 [Aliihoeflea aestuarii]|uniref:hypothetical protein n=1 Tax=Aliihoeflea aestuarii TaxID=453840 RepID=UPI0020953846|nr:hypothetical protein [Aliihoeflea aestuarii]MCO6392931.1 hypothetical protein [Aliihoeflea aestuarii]